jgi:hypothetical protein
MALATRAPETPEVSLKDLLLIKTGDDQTTVLGITMRSNAAGNLLSVKDLIRAVEGCSKKTAQSRIDKLSADGHIYKTHPGINEFKYQGSCVLGARLDVLACVCFHLKSERARIITRKICEIGVRYIDYYEPHRLTNLLEYKRTATGASIFGKKIRVDEMGDFVSVKDAITIIDECSAKASQSKLSFLRAKGIIFDNQPGMTEFKHEVSYVLGAQLDMLAFVCFHLKSERARVITRGVFEVGLQYLNKESVSATGLSFARRRTREKEREVVQFIKQEFTSVGWLFDKSIDNNNGYRPDALLRMSSHAIVVEIDENQHARYDVVAEKVRIETIQKDVGTPVVFIRFNPDTYVDGDGEKHDPCWKFDTSGLYFAHNREDWTTRLKTLRATLLRHMSQAPSDLISEVNLFFSNKKRCRRVSGLYFKV